MKNEFVKVQNALKFSSAYKMSEQRSEGIPGMGLLYGAPGYGKTSAAIWLINLVNGVYVRANAFWTPTSMMTALLEEMQMTPLRSCAKMLEKVIELVETHRRPLFIDEADYLLVMPRMLEALRDIHDCTGVPIWLIGMDGIERELSHLKKITRRISQWVEFNPCCLQDTSLLAKKLCEITVTEDLQVKLHAKANGSIGLITLGLSHIEAEAKRQKWKTIDADQWGDRPFFL